MVKICFIETLNVLTNCKTSIEEKCTYETTVLTDYKKCYETAKLFSAKIDGTNDIEGCLGSAATICQCFNDLDDNTVDEIIACKVDKLSEEDVKIKKAKDTCKLGKIHS